VRVDRSVRRQFRDATWPLFPGHALHPAPMKQQDSIEAVYALIFAVCVLLALFLLIG
jgi:hypothetical protein